MDGLAAGPYGAAWRQLRPSEQRYLQAMAASQSDPVPVADITRRLGLTARSLSAVRQRLIDQRLIVPAGPGQLRFTLPAYRAFIHHHGGPPHAIRRSGRGIRL